MKFTNVHNLPEPVVLAITAFAQPDELRSWDYSVTELINPPQMNALKRIHVDELEEDVADGMWRLLGSALHVVLERAGASIGRVESRMILEIEGRKVGAKPDFLSFADGVLYDWKVTSAWSIVYADKPEWDQQLNCYAHFLRKDGASIKALRVCALLRDWSETKAMQDPAYPQCPFQIIEVEMWPEQAAADYLSGRVRLHKSVEWEWKPPNSTLVGAELPPCQPAERWAKPDTFAVMKAGRKSAVRVLESEELALAFISKDCPTGTFVKRPGESVRCARYCPVSKWCKQRQAEVASKENGA